MDSTLTSALLVLLFVIIGGVFAATEIALVSLRESQLSALEKQSPRGARVAAVARDPNRFLAAVQIGVTVAGFFSAAYGGSTLAPALAPYLQDLGMAPAAAETTALIVLTLLIAYLSLVLGELVPKRLALQKSAAVSLAAAPVLDRFATLMRPMIWGLSLSTNALVRLLGGDPKATSEQLSEDELRELVATHEELDDDERRIIADVFAAADTPLRRVMRPRGEVAFLSGDQLLVEAADEVRTLPHSRFPVAGTGFDDIIGFLHVRDLLGLAATDRRRVRDVARPVLMLPDSNLLLDSVSVMREEGAHLAIVVDEYGGTDGIVTLEDLVEEMLGQIHDEYDVREPEPEEQDLARIKGSTSLDDFATLTGIELPPGSYETVAGYLMAELGRIPVVGHHVEVEGRHLSVVEMDGHRIVAISLTGGQQQPDH